VEDIKAYIESGILELYVLGDVSPAEKLQVEEMASKHPVIKAELDEIERSMELYAAENAIEPTEHMRDRILNSLVVNLADDNNFPTKASPVKDNVVTLTPPKQNNFYKYAFAACLALLIASVVVIISMSNKLDDANTQLLALNSTNQHFANTVKFMDHQLSIYRDPSFKFVKLNPTVHAPKTASIMVAFNPEKKKVMLDMANVNMPKNDKDHQYQLWAIVDKKPVSLGVFDKTDADSVEMKEMGSVVSPQAFAVTLEPRGGSVNPTMDQMMVIGTF
jgi:hypothetical protein